MGDLIQFPARTEATLVGGPFDGDTMAVRTPHPMHITIQHPEAASIRQHPSGTAVPLYTYVRLESEADGLLYEYAG